MVSTPESPSAVNGARMLVTAGTLVYVVPPSVTSSTPTNGPAGELAASCPVAKYG
jgi:hypothetical protein